ncbi:MAG: DinB family protein [Chloroflexi bacterium]|nr:DinB family protein [Chloroflexota bacterium]
MKFTEIYQELVNSTGVIRALTANVSQEEARSKPTPESWSMLEVVCHLHDEEREDFREHLDFILHRQERETWKEIDPQSWAASRKYNEQNFVETQMKFLEEREKSLDWLIDLSRADWDVTCTTPFGVISAGDILVSWAAHDNLHIRQLVELKRHQIETTSRPYKIDYAGDW